jgi:hypothetical protein
MRLFLFVRASIHWPTKGIWPGKRITKVTYPYTYTLGLIHIFAVCLVCSSFAQIMEMKCMSVEIGHWLHSHMLAL